MKSLLQDLTAKVGDAFASAGYDRAELALWDVRTGQEDHQAALAAARAVPGTSPLSRRARFLAGVSLLDLKRHDEAFDAFKTWIDAAPTSAGPAAGSDWSRVPRPPRSPCRSERRRP